MTSAACRKRIDWTRSASQSFSGVTGLLLQLVFLGVTQSSAVALQNGPSLQGGDTLNECSAVQHVERAAGPNSQLETDYMRGD
jgi:hypothetical protein